MALSLLIAAAAAQSGAASPPSTFSPPAEHCAKATNYHAFDSTKPVKPRKLTDLPTANAYSTVYRRVGGCEVPVIVRYNVGGQR